MNENYTVINGKREELTFEQLKVLGLEKEVKTPFARAKKRERYYYINKTGRISHHTEYNTYPDDDCFAIGNYCIDKELLQQRAYMEALNRLLWRYSMERDGDKIMWHDGFQDKYHIIFINHDNEYSVARSSYCHDIGAPCFYSENIAKAAIEEVIKPFLADHPDFKYQEAM